MNKIPHMIMFRRRGALIAAAAALLAAVPALPQSAPPAKPTPPPGEYAIYELSPFAGYQWFQLYANSSTRISKFDSGVVLGLRMTEDYWKYIGLEQSFTVGFNDFLIHPYGVPQFAEANAHNYNIAVNPVFYMTPRESKLRPFITVGPGLAWYTAGKTLNTSSMPGAIPPLAPLSTHYSPSLIYGLGVKYNATRSIGLRVDVRGTWTQDQHYSLPDYQTGIGSFYSPDHGSENALMVTGGITFRFGHRTDYVPPAPPPPAPKPVADIRISGVSGAKDVCPGENVRLDVAATGWLPDQTPSYQWMVNGEPVAGATASSFVVPTVDGSGSKSITVKVSVPDSSKTSDPVTVRVKDYSAPTVQFALAQSSVPFGTKVPLNATARGSECGGPPTLRYTTSDGSISGDTLDTGTLAFDSANRLKQQSKVVHLTATATDAKGGTGSATADVTVTLSPEARRLDDIVFPAGNARVNNCAKRLLIEQLTPMLRDDPKATVILIGHRDEREKGKVAAKLDRSRTLNAAAVLSAGTGICPQLELSRVKVNWVGTDQSSPTRPLLCGSSTDVKERSGQAIKSNDQRAQFRRVEVWIVPGGAAMPAGVSGLQDAPASEVTKLGCPK